MRADQRGTLLIEHRQAFGTGRLARVVGDIEREEITRRNESIHRVQVDVIGIHKVGRGPVQRLHSGIRLGAETLGLRADEGVLAVGLVPNRMKRHTSHGGGLDRGKLGLALMGEAVAHADGESWEFFHNDGIQVWWCGGGYRMTRKPWNSRRPG